MSPILQTLASAVAPMAPTLATMLGGPFAGMAVTALEGAFGLKSGAGPQAITDVIAGGGMTPDTLAAVRAADQHHTEIMGQQGIDLVALNAKHEETFAQIAAADRDSARQRQIALRDRTPQRLAYMIIGGAFAVTLAQLAALTFWPEAMAKVPTQGWLLIGNITGYLWSEASGASSFFFGTTSDSGKKTQALVDIAKEP